jgi:hypothetical protein
MRGWLSSLDPNQIQAFAAAANIVLTIGLLLFAGMQWWVTQTSEQARKLEREADANAERLRQVREEEASYQLVWAEQFRLNSLAESWNDGDLVELSLLELLRPADVIAGDWPLMLQTLTGLSLEAGYLGGMARTLAHDIERQATLFNTAVGGLRGNYTSLSVAQHAKHIRKTHGEELGRMERGLREAARELSLVVADAIRHTPAASRDLKLTFSEKVESQIGRGAREAFLNLSS